MNEQYTEQRKEFEARFNLCLKIADSDREFISPSNPYELETPVYGNNQEVCRKYSRAIVSKVS
jgi:hypothetical protein